MSFMTASLDPFFLSYANFNQRELLAQYHDAFQNYLPSLSGKKEKKKKRKHLSLNAGGLVGVNLPLFSSFFPVPGFTGRGRRFVPRL